MKSVTILIAAAILSSTAFASTKDPFFEERYRAKNGRYTSSEEARRKAAADADKAASVEQCQHAKSVALTTNQAFQADRLRIKYGRSTPAAEDCQSECERMHAVSKDVSPVSVTTDAELRYSLKYGRMSPTAAARVETSAPATLFVAAMPQVCCQQGCCQGS